MLHMDAQPMLAVHESPLLKDPEVNVCFVLFSEDAIAALISLVNRYHKLTSGC